MQSCRDVFCHLTTPPADRNLGLWLDRSLKQQPDIQDTHTNKQAHQQASDLLLRQAETVTIPDGYREFVERWRHDLQAEKVLHAEATCQGRTVVGLGAKNALEFGLHLDRTWGVPVLPGSSQKGLAAAAAHQLASEVGWKKGGALHTWLFGTTDQAGCVQFLDAWWVPEEKAKCLAVHRDVVTVHHPDYYAGQDSPPSDMDDPNPVGFLSVTGTFVIAVQGEPQWADVAMALLKKGLAELGIGAKTNAGYGRMAVAYLTQAEQQEAALAVQKKQERDNEARLADEVRKHAAEQEAQARKLAEQAVKHAKALKDFQGAVAKAKPETLQKIVDSNWSGLGTAQLAAAAWLIDTYCGGRDGAKRYWDKPWFKKIRENYKPRSGS